MTDPFDLHRTNINLYARDVEWLRRTYGYGWTEKVRDMIASAVRNQKLVREEWKPEYGMKYDNPEALARKQD